MLKRQVALKFGQIAPGVLARIDAAAPEELAIWTDRILTAGTVEETFG
jgi:hypothetical protein